MWNRMGRQGDECNRFRTALEDCAVASSGSESVEELLEAMPPMARTHFAACPECQEAARDLLTALGVLREAVPESIEPGPLFSGRVMAGIPGQEK